VVACGVFGGVPKLEENGAITGKIMAANMGEWESIGWNGGRKELCF